jgi:hypothetical protein
MDDMTEPTEDEIREEPLLQLFRFAHLRDGIMRATSARFCQLARHLVATVPRNPERSTAIRRLREAKDCAITALLWVEPTRAQVTR